MVEFLPSLSRTRDPYVTTHSIALDMSITCRRYDRHSVTYHNARLQQECPESACCSSHPLYRLRGGSLVGAENAKHCLRTAGGSPSLSEHGPWAQLSNILSAAQHISSISGKMARNNHNTRTTVACYRWIANRVDRNSRRRSAAGKSDVVKNMSLRCSVLAECSVKQQSILSEQGDRIWRCISTCSRAPTAQRIVCMATRKHVTLTQVRASTTPFLPKNQ